MFKKTIVHVNQHNIRKADGSPVLTVKDYKENRKGNVAEVEVDGRVIGKFVYSPDKPLPCGAKVWFETHENVRVL